MVFPLTFGANMTFYFHPELCGPAVCSGFAVLVMCVVANTVLNIVNSIQRWDWVRWINRNPSLR